MQGFKATDRLEIEAVTEMERAYLVIRDLDEAKGGDPLFVVVYPEEIKALCAALVEAAVWLASQGSLV